MSMLENRETVKKHELSFALNFKNMNYTLL